MNVSSYRGKPVLSWLQGVVTGSHGIGHGQGHYEIVDTSYRQVAQVFGHQGYQGDLHEFILTPQGTALFTCYGHAWRACASAASCGMVPYLFGVVQEVDVATGKLLFHWRSDQHVPLTDSYIDAGAEARLDLGLLPHQRDLDRSQRQQPRDLGPQHLRLLQGQPQDRQGDVAARRQAQRLPDGRRARASTSSTTSICTPAA